MSEIAVFDTTLRDGEQSPRISLGVDAKVEIATQLERLEVDVIEAGFPASSRDELAAVRAVAAAVDRPIVAALARVASRDVARAAEALGPARRARIHSFIATSPVHMKAKLRMSENQVLEAAVEGVENARTAVSDVEFSCEDSTRSDPLFLAQVFRAAADAGATTLNVPDTVGYALPDEFAALLSFLIAEVDRDVVWSVHTHDDLGLAVANALAGLAAGARQVEVAVNGIGERAGNCALEEVVMALRTRRSSNGLSTRTATRELLRTSDLVAQLTGYAVPPNKAVVGDNAFAHEAGIHQHGVMMDRSTYEIMDPCDVGFAGSRLVLGKHSGRHAFSRALRELGLDLDVDATARAFERFKALAAATGAISDSQLRDVVLSDEPLVVPDAVTT